MPILRASNISLLSGKERSWLTANASAGDSTATVQDYAQFSTGQYVLIGDFGDEKSEIIRIHASTAPTSAGVVTFASNLVYGHSIDDKVTQIDFNQVVFYHSTTTATGGIDQTLATQAIEADDIYSTYNDTTNSTGYVFVRFYNSATAAYSSYSTAVAYTGIAINSVRKLKDNALSLTHETVSDLISDDFLLDELNNWQQDVARQKDWSWELESATDTVVSGQKSYSFPTSPASFKYTSTNKSFLQVRIKNFERLDYIDKAEYDQAMVNTISSTLASAISSTADGTSVVLTSSNDFNSSGTILIGDGTADEISYTANNTTTDTLSGTTNISTTHSSGATVWQTSSLNEPKRYTVYDGAIFLEPVASSTEHGYTIYYDYYKAIPTLTSDASETIIPFYHVAQYYLAWKIEIRKRNKDMGDYYRILYENRLGGEMRRDRTMQYGRFVVATNGDVRTKH